MGGKTQTEQIRKDDIYSLPIGFSELASDVWKIIDFGYELSNHINQVALISDELSELWEVRRHSRAVYEVRPVGRHESIVLKFYSEKSRSHANQYAKREHNNLQKMDQSGFGEDLIRVVRPLGLWRVLLLLEMIEGETLSTILESQRISLDHIHAGVQCIGVFLARLHQWGTRPDHDIPMGQPLRDAIQYVEELQRYDVLKEALDQANRVIDALQNHWEQSELVTYTPSLVHGDATTANFVLPPIGGVVATDFELQRITDPTFDVGRFQA